jgi:hypothetical protein
MATLQVLDILRTEKQVKPLEMLTTVVEEHPYLANGTVLLSKFYRPDSVVCIVEEVEGSYIITPLNIATLHSVADTVEELDNIFDRGGLGEDILRDMCVLESFFFEDAAFNRVLQVFEENKKLLLSTLEHREMFEECAILVKLETTDLGVW